MSIEETILNVSNGNFDEATTPKLKTGSRKRKRIGDLISDSNLKRRIEKDTECNICCANAKTFIFICCGNRLCRSCFKKSVELHSLDPTVCQFCNATINNYRELKLFSKDFGKSMQSHFQNINPATTQNFKNFKNLEFIPLCAHCNPKQYLSPEFLCPKCSLKHCTDCAQPCFKNHTCDQSEIKVLTLLRKDCKNCPNCKIYIFKAWGCNHMWCSQCHHRFNWHTGEIAIFSNPMLAEYNRSRGIVDHIPGNLFFINRVLFYKIYHFFFDNF